MPVDATRLNELKRAKGALVAKLSALVAKEDELPDGEGMSDADKADFAQIQADIASHNERIGRVESVLAEQADAAGDIIEVLEEGPDSEVTTTGHVPGAQRRKPVVQANEPAIVLGKGHFVGAIAKLMGMAKSPTAVPAYAKEVYGERHPVTRAIATRAMTASIGPNGGFMVPPDYVREIIELLRPACVIRDSGPRVLAMPRGTMTMPKQTQAATATYAGEITPIPVSQEALGEIVASYKTLTALVPVSNDLLRFSDPSAEAFIQPVGPLTFYGAAQTDTPVSHKIVLRWLNYLAEGCVVLRQTVLPGGQRRTEQFRVRRVLEIGGRKRFVEIEAELEGASTQ